MGNLHFILLSLFVISSVGWINAEESKPQPELQQKQQPQPLVPPPKPHLLAQHKQEPTKKFDYSEWKLIDATLIPHDNENPIVRMMEDFNDIRIFQEDRSRDLVRLLVSPENFDDVAWKLTTDGHKIRTSVNDFSQIMTPAVSNARTDFLPKGDVTFTRYMSFQEIEDYIKKLQQKYPDKVRRRVLGITVEGRNIHALVITNRGGGSSDSKPAYATEEDEPLHHEAPHSEEEKADSESVVIENARFANNEDLISETLTRKANKPVIFIDGGMHAREWASPSAVLNVAEKLIESPSLTRNFEWWLVPVVNPDGYIYSWEHDRLWRKNRARTNVEHCNGVDLNRNFDHHWMEAGASANPCVEVYAGPNAFSEPETRAVRDALLKVQDRLEAYVSVHTYGQVILYSYGYSATEVHPNQKEMESMADGMAKAIYRQHGTNYDTGSAGSALYAAGGGSDDWATDIGGASVSFTFELRDKGEHGFLLPESQIKPTADELWTGIQYMAKSIQKRNAEKQVRDTDTPQLQGFRPIPVRAVTNYPSQPQNYGINYVSKVSLKPLPNRSNNPIIKIEFDRNNNPVKAVLMPQVQNNIQPNMFNLQQQIQNQIRDSNGQLQSPMMAVLNPGFNAQQQSLMMQQPGFNTQHQQQQQFMMQQQQPNYHNYQPSQLPLGQSVPHNQYQLQNNYQSPMLQGQQPLTQEQQLILYNQHASSLQNQLTGQGNYVFQVPSSSVLNQQSNLQNPQNMGNLRHDFIQQGQLNHPNNLQEGLNNPQTQYFTLYQPSVNPFTVPVHKPTSSQTSQFLPQQNYQFQGTPVFQLVPLHNVNTASQYFQPLPFMIQEDFEESLEKNNEEQVEHKPSALFAVLTDQQNTSPEEIKKETENASSNRAVIGQRVRIE